MEDEEGRLARLQSTNRELGLRLKEKDAQLARLRELNRELRRLSKVSRLPSNDDIQEVRVQLADRDGKLQVFFYFFNFILYLRIKRKIFYENVCKELVSKQEMIEKSHRRQLMAEVKKKQSFKKQLMSANEVIYSLENCLKVCL